ncbi:hypothetical protein J4772_11395 [Cohnella sp. LGH]|uniref:hypothetical protein n=1 Tax=Cohnella sp. LGH TaxID=1619153 RepID=UPI001ADAF50A|nr:hypothetical protein [Cohnella sp. LGH]QTH44945.1 hypothetical protein J4772_11395 [Cohnella sp. LGH]
MAGFWQENGRAFASGHDIFIACHTRLTTSLLRCRSERGGFSIYSWLDFVESCRIIWKKEEVIGLFFKDKKTGEVFEYAGTGGTICLERKDRTVIRVHENDLFVQFEML